jgi:hypothetical protein
LELKNIIVFETMAAAFAFGGIAARLFPVLADRNVCATVVLIAGGVFTIALAVKIRE